MIIHAVNKELLKSRIPFKVLDRESFDIILEELIRKIRLTPKSERKRPNLLMTKYFLILETHECECKTVVLMQLVDHGEDIGRILATQFEELKNDKPILEQIPRNFLNDLEKLRL